MSAAQPGLDIESSAGKKGPESGVVALALPGGQVLILAKNYLGIGCNLTLSRISWTVRDRL